MAQETRVNPIQLNDNAQKIIMNFGDTLEKIALQKEQTKAKQAEQAYARQTQYDNQYSDLQKWYYDKATSLKASPEEIDKALAAGKEALAAAHLKGTSIGDMNTIAQNYLGQVKYAAGVRDVVDGQVEGAAKQNPEVDQASLRAYLEKNVLFGRDPKTVDVNVNHAKDAIYNPNNWNLFDFKKSLETYTNQIEKGPQTEEAEKTVDTNGVWRSNESKRVKFNPQFFEQDGKGGFKLKTDADGLFAAKDYNAFISNPANNAVLENRTQNFIDHYNAAPSSAKQRMLKEYVGPENWDALTGKKNLPDKIDPSDTDLRNTLKRTFLTHDLSASPTLSTQSQGNIQTKITVQTGASTPTPKDVIPAIDNTIKGFTVRKATDGKDIKNGAIEVGAPINKIESAAAQAAIIKLTNDIAGKSDSKYNVEDLVIKKLGNNSYGIYDFSTNKQLTTLTSDDINIAANGDLGVKVKNAAHNNMKNKQDRTGASGL